MMKIGILTYYWQDNPGQFFQALASLEALQRRFPAARVEIVNVHHWHAPWRPSLRWKKFLPSIRKHKGYVQARQRLPLSPELLVTTDRRKAMSYIARQGYDALVVGSDVVLKPLPKILGEQVPLYWPAPELKMPKFLLASSADTTRAEDLTVSQRDEIKACLESFSLLAVRDVMTWNLLVELGIATDDKRLRRIADPTFTMELPSLNTVGAQSCEAREKPVCGIHLPRNTFTVQLVELLRSRFRIVAIGGLPWPGIPWWGGGPEEWRTFFTRLDLVVTVSFHESIFAARHHVPVLAVDAEPYRIDLKSGLSKTFCLMEDLLLPHCHVNPHNGTCPEAAYDQALRAVAGSGSRTLAQCADSYNAAVERIAEILSPQVHVVAEVA